MPEPLSGDTFINRILEGVTDFKGAILEKGFDLSGHPRFAELQEHLAAAAPPLRFDFSGCRMNDLKARGWFAAQSTWVGAQLDGVDFSEARLEGGDFTEASMKRSALGRAVMHGATCIGAKLEQSNLEEANLEGVNFWKAKLSHVTFHKACLRDGLLSEAELDGADFSACDLSKANLWGASLAGASFSSTLMRETFFRGMKGLEQARHLSRARWRKCRMGRGERELILRDFDRLGFVIED